MTLRSYPRERLVLALVTLATLPILFGPGAQDITRLSLTESVLTRGHVDIDPWWTQTTDRAFAHGHWYADKAPGVSFALLVPDGIYHAVAQVSPGLTEHLPWNSRGLLWLFRLLAEGIPCIALVALVGRACEGLVRGTGAAAAVVVALGTIVGALGPTLFAHLADAVFLFGAFLAATRARTTRGWLAVGLLAGAAVLCDYLAGPPALVLVALAWMRERWGAVVPIVLGGVPAVLALGAYDWAAFGSPLHLSYRYVSNTFTTDQQNGFFGIGVPTGHGISETLFDHQGLLVLSPVLLLAAAGLVDFARSHRAEAIAAAVIAAFFVVTTTSYFLPDGGLSPGPRFAAPALPFLALGLPYAFRRRRVITVVLALYSVGIETANALTWWTGSSFAFVAWTPSVYSALGLSAELGTLLMLLPAVAAVVIAAVALVPVLRRQGAGPVAG